MKTVLATEVKVGAELVEGDGYLLTVREVNDRGERVEFVCDGMTSTVRAVVAKTARVRVAA